jgi:hypothetical protein
MGGPGPRFLARSIAALLLLTAPSLSHAQATQHAYAGFDRNDYPGDAALAALRKNFDYTSYWLGNPPGSHRNSWVGKRALLKQNGFGFLLLFNGRAYAELKGKDAAALGTADGKAAVAAAAREGFPANALIFLDQEEGGRLLAEQASYVFAWTDAVSAAGVRAGVYCSGIDVPEGSGTISTARDIVARESVLLKSSSKGKSADRLKLWIANDQCPPSPGCRLAHPPLSAAAPAVADAVVVWQYAQSPRRMTFTAKCPANYAPDRNCYAPGLAHSSNTFIDLNTADSPDPSGGR